MRRREPVEDMSPPEHVRTLDPARYVDEIETHLAGHPADCFGAAMAAWRPWCRERYAWEKAHGLAHYDAWRRRNEVLGQVSSPPFEWVAAVYGIEPYRIVG